MTVRFYRMEGKPMTVRHLAAPMMDRNWDSLQFRTIFALSFVVYFAVALVTRLSPSYWRADVPHRSVFADACTGAGTTAQMAFAG